MRPARTLHAALVSLALGVFASSASASVVTYVTPTDAANGSSTIPTTNAYTSNLGYAFIAGPSGPYSVDWITLELSSSSTNLSGSVNVEIRDTTNLTPYSAVAGTTALATDTVTFTMPGTTATLFTVNLTAADLPNISAYQLQSNTGYALILWDASTGMALRRTQGLPAQSNGNYTVSSGFTMLDTFRNNTPDYQNVSGSYVTFHMSFGSTAASVSEPSSVALLSTILVGGLVSRFRKRKS
jgi:hypothetical protein